MRVLLLGGRVVDLDEEHEAVELGLGQRVGALLLDRVLGGEDEEGRLERGRCVPSTVTLCSCMASSRADWVLAGARLISSARTMLAKTGPWTNSNSRRPPAPDSWMMSVPVMSAGIRSGVNWMRLKLRSKRLGEGGDQQGLGEAGDAHQEGVAAGEEADRELLDDLVLADDDLGRVPRGRPCRCVPSSSMAATSSGGSWRAGSVVVSMGGSMREAKLGAASFCRGKGGRGTSNIEHRTSNSKANIERSKLQADGRRDAVVIRSSGVILGGARRWRGRGGRRGGLGQGRATARGIPGLADAGVFEMIAAMKRSISGILVLAMGGFAMAGEWVELFDGKTLAGWTAANGKKPGEGWEVVDGAIHRKSAGGNIVSEKEYEDFELEFEWKVAKGANSGFRYRFRGGVGPEYQVLDDVNHGNGKNPKTSAASLYAVAHPRPTSRSSRWASGTRRGSWPRGRRSSIG